MGRGICSPFLSMPPLPTAHLLFLFIRLLGMKGSKKRGGGGRSRDHAKATVVGKEEEEVDEEWKEEKEEEASFRFFPCPLLFFPVCCC